MAATSVAAVALVLGPLSMLLIAAFRGPQDLLPFEPGAQWTLANLAAIYLDANLYRSIIPDTFIFTAGSVTLTFVIAFALAWLVERTDLPLRDGIYTVVLFPLLVPGIVFSITWIFLLAPNTGWVNVALRAMLGRGGEGPLNIFSMGGMILVQGIGLVPFIFLLLSAALRSMNPTLEEAGNVSGASPLKTFLRVTLPVLRPGLLAPLILGTLVTLEQFETPLVIGFPARINVFSTRIFFELNPDTDLPAYGRAAATALPFLVIGVLLLLLYNHLVRKAERFVTVTGKGFRRVSFKLGRWRIPALIFVAAYAVFGAVLPVFVLVWASLFGYAFPSFKALPSASAAGYLGLFANANFWLAIRNTFIVGGGQRGDRDIDRRCARLDHLAQPDDRPVDRRFRQFSFARNPDRHRRLGVDAAVSVDPHRHLWNGRSARAGLLLSYVGRDAPHPRRGHANSYRVGGGLVGRRRSLVHDAPAGSLAVDQALPCHKLRALIHCRIPRVHAADDPAVGRQRGAERDDVEGFSEREDDGGRSHRHRHRAAGDPGHFLRAEPGAGPRGVRLGCGRDCTERRRRRYGKLIARLCHWIELMLMTFSLPSNNGARSAPEAW